MPGPTYCTFANTLYSRGFDFTFAPGVQPSICTLRTVPHTANIPDIGTLVFRTEGEAPFVFNECKYEQPQLTANQSGKFITLPIMDRRWKWQWGAVYGWYNKPEPDGSYTREKTPQELASILLTELNESGFDVSRLPNTTRPEKQWDGSLPAAELEALCAELGCVVVLNPLTDKVELWPVGQGSALPTGATVGKAYAPILPAQPQYIRIEAGPTKYQGTFQTEPVGQDTDGRWKHIDNLSYKPASGWRGDMAALGFPNFPDTMTYVSGGRTLKVRDLAAATVFRCYRVTGLLGGGWNTPNTAGDEWSVGGITRFPLSLKDIQLSDELLDEEISTADGGLRALPAKVFARWSRLDKGTTPAKVIHYPDSFGLDPEFGIISFGEPLFMWGNGTGGSLPAEVHYECAFHAGADGVLRRSSFGGGIVQGSAVTPSRVITVPEINLRVVFRYSETGQVTATEKNSGYVNGALIARHIVAESEYGIQEGGTLNYAGLQRISPDGLTQQITWSGGGGRDPQTIVSQAQRHNRYIKPLDEVRERLQVKRNALQIQQLALRGVARLLGGGV